MPKERDTRVRNYAFTLNNYTEEEEKELKELFDDADNHIKYIVYGKEVGKQNTPHLQGTIVFNNKKTWDQVKELLGRRYHVGECEKGLKTSILYCKKDGDITEYGRCPLTKEQQGEYGHLGKEAGIKYWKEQLEAIKSGNEEMIDPKLYITHFRNIELIRQKEQKKKSISDTNEKMLWFAGLTGTGKSRTARTLWPNAYLKPVNKWWDHYDGEEVVIIEDFDLQHKVLAYHLKIWGDRYKFPAECKNGTLQLRPKLIVVTSNWTPEEIWNKSEDRNSLDPILRRYQVYIFPLQAHLINWPLTNKKELLIDVNDVSTQDLLELDLGRKSPELIRDENDDIIELDFIE